MSATCGTCAHWAGYSDGRGECTASDENQHEAVVGVVIYRRADPEGLVFRQLPPRERADYSALLVTPADFGCTSWVPREGPGV